MPISEFICGSANAHDENKKEYKGCRSQGDM